ncbi:hypothetical protein FIBSPDRAFT_1041839 [Athelia psychrophila]|uniref:CSC1/OSCA1-like N-terminal transmembrane domain-containing protein n=1 Tax=Athelia psychrophila TaxID=1759441 RepID=A0A166NJ88_9AGAM|nr:hypothetical protein FIBSPDRAFT_1041839 [Fibularhizoctonia sp. CBS 109695]
MSPTISGTSPALSGFRQPLGSIAPWPSPQTLILTTIRRPRFESAYEARTLTSIASYCARKRLDAYFFVRFLRVIIIAFLPIWALSWAILMPVDAVNASVAGKVDPDIFFLRKVVTDEQERYAAHCTLFRVFTFWIFWNIRREMACFIAMRREFFALPGYAKSVGVPLPRQAPQRAPEAYDRPLKACNKLESAKNALLKMAVKIRRKQLKKAGGASLSTPPNNDSDGAVDALTRPSHDYDHQQTHDQDQDPEAQAFLAEKLVPASKRLLHRLPAGFMPLALPYIGQKVD